ncbi:TetR family transcriptional regulator [Nostoc sp. HK-01]|nr:TetR family transcriptional regulator [Nostoc sp. HK-01]
MRINLNTIDELWDLEKPVISPRSRLFSLEPIGLGTPYVESLTSYIVRLAETHGTTISKLVISEIVPILRPENTSYNTNFYNFSSIGSSTARGALNGTGLMAINLIQALQKLTLRSDLCFLTMLPWAEVIGSQKGLSRHIKAWCPICYEEWHEKGQVIYEPLMWTLDVVKACPHHHQRLQTQCPHCHKQLLPLEEKTRLGYCSKCRGWLGSCLETKQEPSQDELNWQLWVADSIGEVIATAPSLEYFLNQEDLQMTIRRYVSQIFGSCKDFAALIGKSDTIVYEWVWGDKIPQLITSVQISHVLGISLLDFLMGEIVCVNRAWIAKQRQSQKLQKLYLPHTQNFDWEPFRQALITALEEYPPLRMTEVIKRFGFIPTTSFYTRFPELTKALKERYLDYQKAEREQIKSDLIDILLADEYPPPSLEDVARRVGSEYKMNKYFPDLCRKILDKYLAYRKAHKLELSEKRCQQIRQIALELYSTGIEPTNHTVSKRLGKTGILKNKNVQAALRKVRFELGYEKSYT